MKILFFISARRAEEEARKIPLPEKLLMIFRARVEDAKDQEARERAELELAKVEAKLTAR
jgi:hypothetical protein